MCVCRAEYAVCDLDNKTLLNRQRISLETISRYRHYKPILKCTWRLRDIDPQLSQLELFGVLVKYHFRDENPDNLPI